MEPEQTAAQRGVYISTYGCQMNDSDTERMYSLLEMQNYARVAEPEQAELIIINSCSVREKPVHKVRSEVGRYRALKAANPRLRVGVGGCVAQQEKQKLLNDVPTLDFVFGTDAIDQLPAIVERARATGAKVVSARFENEKSYQIETLIRNPGVAAFVNIAKGCDNFCSFCVVPFTRGRERSRQLSELMADARALGARGVREITLLGQNVNSYRSSCGASFADLLRALAEGTDLQRIRYTTSHPKDFSQELVDISQKYRAKIMDYIHLPAQSGNSGVLARMNRSYSREEYLDKVRMIREGLPGVALSTDIIVGFPGESESHFADTMSLIEEVRYENVYAFKYSPRPFTKAARFPDQVDEVVKSRRLTSLFERQRAISFEVSAAYLGRTLDVLVEEVRPSDGLLCGRTSQNRLAVFPAPEGEKGAGYWVGRTLPVRVASAVPAVLKGAVAPQGAHDA
jgi:tRNA-2-methylthio-N6-dimethylallyladenosine synthase